MEKKKLTNKSMEERNFYLNNFIEAGKEYRDYFKKYHDYMEQFFFTEMNGIRTE